LFAETIVVSPSGNQSAVIYYVKPDRSQVYFVTSQPAPEFIVES